MIYHGIIALSLILMLAVGVYVGKDTVYTDAYKNCRVANIEKAICSTYIKMLKDKEYLMIPMKGE